MKTIRCTSTLFYYDGPQVLEARDAIGGHYLVLMLNAEPERDRCLAVGVPPARLREFRIGAVELRSLLLDAAQDEWFLATPTNLNDPLVLKPQSTSIAATDLLPDHGFLLHNRPATDFALQEARSRQNLVLEISVEPPESVSEARIRVDTYTQLLYHVQTIAKHAWRTASRGANARQPQAIDATAPHLMDVVIPAAPGSFRILLEAATKPDMFGQSHLSPALRRMDILFEHASNPQDTLSTLREHRGHLAGAYLRLLRFLVHHKTGIRYAWAEPASSEPSCRQVLQSEAGPLVEVLSGISNLSSEPVTLVGTFEKFNRKTGTWGLSTEGGLLSGQIGPGGPNLDGLTVRGRYTFSCVEEIEEIQGTGRETRTLYLKDHEPA